MNASENNTFALTLRGMAHNGKPIVPEAISLGILAGFTENFRNLVLDDSVEVSIEKGSFKAVAFMASAGLNVLHADMLHIERGDYGAVSSPKRLAAAKRLEKQARKHDVEIDFSIRGQKPFMTVGRKFPLLKKSETWVPITTVIEGKIIDIGGKNPNLHIDVGGEW